MQMKKRARDSETFFFNIVDLYGCRPSDESLLYLSPFEFIMWWDVCSLEAPPFPEDAAERARKRLPVYKLTRWCVPAAELAALRCDPGFKPVPGEHYEVDTEFIQNEWDVPNRTRYRTYPSDDSVPGLRRVRSQFFLRRRLREVVPSPQGPMPHRGVNNREHRAKLYSLYVRPWVLIRSHATPRVPHLANLDKVVLRRWDSANADSRSVMVQRRCVGKQNLLADPRARWDWNWSVRSYDEAWRRYIRGNVVSDHAERLIRNFLSVMAGTGKHNDEEELTGTSHRSRADFGDPGRRITVTDLDAILRPQDPTKLWKRRGGATTSPNASTRTSTWLTGSKNSSTGL